MKCVQDESVTKEEYEFIFRNNNDKKNKKISVLKVLRNVFQRFIQRL